tara:strand:- start:497 stop:1609 length:1113 start_codon:yes stop_codon:yes gene_type:complete
MRNKKIKFRNKIQNYSVIIGNNSTSLLPKMIRQICPNTKNIALIVDKNIPSKFKKNLKVKLKSYNLLFLSFNASEKSKSFKTVNHYLNLLLSKNFNRSDLIIAVGGGITGDVTGFVASIFKRGINFINVPSTLLAQVDSAVGGKTGVNSIYGKNLIGSFYQPKLVINDVSLISSLPKKEMICGYAEILKHSIIKDKKFFIWLEKNSKKIFLKKNSELIYAIKKSCEIKMRFVNRDTNEKNLRMILNFGHTFAHAIEVKNNYSKGITHGEAVLSGMILATKISVAKGICSLKTYNVIKNIYNKNNLNYTFKEYSNESKINQLIPHLKNDKKNNDDKINFILLKAIGKTAMPNKSKISIDNLKRLSKTISQY